VRPPLGFRAVDHEAKASRKRTSKGGKAPHVVLGDRERLIRSEDPIGRSVALAPGRDLDRRCCLDVPIPVSALAPAGDDHAFAPRRIVMHHFERRLAKLPALPAPMGQH